MTPLRPRRGKCAGLAVALALALSGSTARAEGPVVYRWIDGDGVAHYTSQSDRIPSDFRDSVQEIRRSGPRPEGVAAAPPAATVSPPRPAAAPPPVAAPPAPRITPEGEFEEPPLGSPIETRETTPSAKAAPAAGASAGVSTAARGGHAGGGTAANTPAPVAAPPPSGAPASVAATPTAAPARADTVSSTPLDSPDAVTLDERIAELERQIDRDEAAIQQIISTPSGTDGVRVAEREDFRELAQRLPQLQASLKALRQERIRQDGR